MNEAVSFKGEPLIVLTRAEYDELVEDSGDIALAHDAMWKDTDAPSMPGELVRAVWDDGLHPLAAWRRSVELTEAELAAKAGLPEATVRAIEAREHDPRLSELKALSGVLKLGIEDIVD